MPSLQVGDHGLGVFPPVAEFARVEACGGGLGLEDAQEVFGVADVVDGAEAVLASLSA